MIVPINIDYIFKICTPKTS